MNKYRWLLVVTALLATLLQGCSGKEEISGRIHDLDGRIAVLEERLKTLNEETVPALTKLLDALTEDGVLVADVATTADGGYVVVFSDGSSCTISPGVAPAIGVVENGGTTYWTVDGKPVSGPDGKPIPVGGATPTFRTGDSGWEVSFDGGATWTAVSDGGSPIVISVDKDADTATITLSDGSSFTVGTEANFAIVLDTDRIETVNNKVGKIPYTIKGLREGDDLLVDGLGNDGLKVRILKRNAGDLSDGWVRVTATEDGVEGSVWVFAANGRGKTDVRTVTFRDGVVESVLSAEVFPGTGGVATMTVRTNLDYEIYIPEEIDWVKVVDTKAMRTETVTLSISPNPGGLYRTATIEMIAGGESAGLLNIFQYPSDDAVTDIISAVNYFSEGDVMTVRNVKVAAASKNGSMLTDGLYAIYADKVLTPGDSLNVTGVLKTDNYKCKYLSVSSVDKLGSDATVTEAPYFYWQWASSLYSGRLTAVHGVLSKNSVGELELYQTAEDESGETEYIEFTYTIDAPSDDLGMEAMVGHKVSVQGYVYSYRQGKGRYKMVVASASLADPYEDPNWTFAYDPEDSEGGSITLTAADPAASPMFDVAIFNYPEAGVTEEFLEGAIEKVSDDMLWYLFYYTQFMANYPIDYVRSQLALTAPVTLNLSTGLAYGRYVAVAVGMDRFGNPTGGYKTLDFTKEDPALEAAYADFLGDWTLADCPWGEAVVTISPDVEGSTYTFTGFAPDPYPLGEVKGFTGTYIDGHIEVYEQDMGHFVNPNDVYKLDNGEYPRCTDHLTALFEWGEQFLHYPFNGRAGKAFAAYLLPGGDVRLRPVRENPFDSSVELSSVGFVLSWSIDEGPYEGKGARYNPAISLPATLEPAATGSRRSPAIATPAMQVESPSAPSEAIPARRSALGVAGNVKSDRNPKL